MKNKNISELKNIHSGQDIYVIASGASLNYISPSFFENKITVGINQVYRKFKCSYLVRKEGSHLAESIATGAKVICSLWDSGDITKGKKKKNTLGNENLSFYVFEHMDNRHTTIDFSILNTHKLIVSYSTITTALHAAAYMGAKNIIIVGHDCGLINDKFVFDGYYKNISETPWKNWNDYINWLTKIESQTTLTKEKLQSHYKCNIYSLNPFINYNLEGNSFSGKNKINLK
jgi:hypothetical protein